MSDQAQPQSPATQPGIDQTNPARQPGERRGPTSVQQDQKLQPGGRQQGSTVPGETVPRTGAETSHEGRGDLLDQAAGQSRRDQKDSRVDPIGGDTGAQS